MNQLMLMCLIADRRAAIPAAEVNSVIEIDAITPIPGTPDYIAGLTALRSQALTVIDCRAALGFPSSGSPVGSRAAVVEHEGHPYALVVDKAFDVEEAQGEPSVVPGGFGRSWQEAAVGLVETDSGPALLVEVAKLVRPGLVTAA